MMVETRPAVKPAIASTVAGDMPWFPGVVMSRLRAGLMRNGVAIVS